ncbi:MAG: glycosyltransferase [Bacteroidetes bacterium]|nr:glycosyltransferase [Bacteroidota bacterium]
MDSIPTISFVLPVYNCYDELAGRLPGFCALLKECGYHYKVIVVDDGSDRGADIEKLITANNGVYIRNPANRGKGYSVRRGFGAAEGEYFVFMDGDFPFGEASVKDLLGELVHSQADMVIGDRTLDKSSFPDDLPWLRRLGSRLISGLAGHYITPGHYDTQCGLKGFSMDCAKAIFPQLTQDRFCFDIELLFIATRRHYRIGRVPVVVRKQPGSTVRAVRDGLDVLRALCVIYFNKITGKYKLD